MCEITMLPGMVGEITKDARTPLLPNRQDQGDFFVCDILDAAPKADMASMAHPIFSLSTKPDHRVRRYEDAQGKNYVEVRPSTFGLATIHDRDVLIYCISQVIAALNEERPVSRTIRMKAYDFLRATNRMTDGRGYEGLRAALRRLQGTQIETNVITGGTEQLDIFSLIDRARIVREKTRIALPSPTAGRWIAGSGPTRGRPLPCPPPPTKPRAKPRPVGRLPARAGLAQLDG